MKTKALMKKNREIILYLIFGLMTTAVFYVIYITLSFSFGLYAWVSTVISQIVAITFAFITNKIFVFASRTKNKAVVLRESIFFAVARLFALGLNTTAMYVLVDLLNFNQIIIQTICQIFIIIFNYIISKWFVFKKK